MSRKSKILVVDDAQAILDAIRDILRGDGYVVETAHTGEEALKVLQRFTPDLILLDVTMPGIDGYEVCRRISADGGFGFIKIIMVSGRTMLKERLKGYEAGADDYIAKPFKAEELLAKVKVFLRLKSVEDQLQELNDSLNEQVRIRTEQLIDAEKMAAIGRYAAGIVHNLNNPLQVIMGNAQLLALKHPDNRSIMMLRRAAAQMKRTIATILMTSCQENVEEIADIDLNEVLKDQLELLKANPYFKHRIKIKSDIKPLPTCSGIYAHFSQSLGNLIKNAADSMYEKKGGELSIFSYEENHTIIIKISDTGCGISPEKMDKIFNPFFTTKPLTAEDDRPTGTGLGLASCKEMIESYGGEIRVRSEPGKGSTFTVRLPMRVRGERLEVRES